MTTASQTFEIRVKAACEALYPYALVPIALSFYIGIIALAVMSVHVLGPISNFLADLLHSFAMWAKDAAEHQIQWYAFKVMKWSFACAAVFFFALTLCILCIYCWGAIMWRR